MTSLLLNIVNNLTERIHKIKCKYGHDDKKCEVYGIKNTKTDCFLEYTYFKNDLNSDSHIPKNVF